LFSELSQNLLCRHARWFVETFHPLWWQKGNAAACFKSSHHAAFVSIGEWRAGPTQAVCAEAARTLLKTEQDLLTAWRTWLNTRRGT